MNITPVTPKLNWAPGVRESINGGKTLPKMPIEDAVAQAEAYAKETRFDTFNKQALTGNVQRPIWADGVREKINGGKALPKEIKEAVAKERMEEAAAKAKEYAQKPRLGEIEIDPKKVQQAKAQVKTEEAKGFFKKALNAVKNHPVITAIVVAVPVVVAAAYGIKKVNENKQAQKA